MVKFVHTSDWQIGMKGGGLGSAGDLVRQARLGSIRNVFEIARKNGAEFVLICGDTFEHNMVGSDDVSAVISIFNEYREVPIYLLPGNHDHIGPGSVYERDVFSRVENLTVFKTADPVALEGMTLHPIPVGSSFTGSMKVDDFSDVKDIPGIHIGVSHGSIVGGFGVAENIDLPIDPLCVDSCGLDYLALGHWHSHNSFHDSEGVIRIAYCGTHEQTKYSERDAGYCLVVEILEKGASPNITPVSCGSLSWGSLNFQMHDRSSIDDLEEALKGQRGNDLFRLELGGSLDIKYKEELDALLEYQETEFKDFRLSTDGFRYDVPLDPDEIFDYTDPTLNQVEIELRRLATLGDPKERATAIEAMSLLQRLSKEAEQ